MFESPRKMTATPANYAVPLTWSMPEPRYYAPV